MTSKEKLLQLRHDFYNNKELNYDSVAYFTTIEKDLEVLQQYKKIEEELGCPLDVVFRLKEQGYFCDFKGRHYEIKSIEFEQHTLPYIEFWINKNYEETSIELLKHYKKTWWLREDMSE